MSRPPLVPPLKCQGIKTKLVPAIVRIAESRRFDRWIEPFCGSCAVALNVQPKRALLCDTNIHIIRLYQDIQSGILTAERVREFLTAEGAKLSATGEPYYYEVRERFNDAPSSLDFLFLNRSCFNGVIRFNRRGRFNVPYCHKSERFAQAYVTKISNQVRQIAQVLTSVDWTFAVRDFRETLAAAGTGDFVYVDPPYAGRHVDYFNSWSETDEADLGAKLGSLKCDFLLSTWYGNEFRMNPAIDHVWRPGGFEIATREHFYHVGASEELRHPMVEALISNFPLAQEPVPEPTGTQTSLAGIG